MNMDLLYDYGGTDSPDLVNSDWQLPPYEMPPIDLPQLLYPGLPVLDPSTNYNHYATQISEPDPVVPIMSAGDFLRQKLSLPAHSEVNLNSLPDPPPGKRPSQSLPFLVMLAIHGSPRKMLTLQEIYKAIEYRFEWYRRPKSREDERAWKGSIRHCLSLWKAFRHRPRPATESGRGHYWYLDLSNGEGYKRERKRRRNRNLYDINVEDDNSSTTSSHRLR